jgi:hypothetical protein
MFQQMKFHNYVNHEAMAHKIPVKLESALPVKKNRR